MVSSSRVFYSSCFSLVLFESLCSTSYVSSVAEGKAEQSIPLQPVSFRRLPPLGLAFLSVGSLSLYCPLSLSPLPWFQTQGTRLAGVP